MPRDLPLPAEEVFRFIADEAHSTIEPGARMSPLTGGAVLRHYRLDFVLREGAFAGPQRWVLRADGATALGIGLRRAPEFAVQRALFRAGLPVAEPLFMCCDEGVIGAPFFLMRFLPGEAYGASVVERGANPALAAELAHVLATLHALDLRRPLHFLPPPPQDAAEARIAELENLLAADEDPHPVAEWALRWLKAHKPEPTCPVLCHGDFRTGNYLVEGGRLTGVLDWDFAGWSDPDEDIAWFCAKAWRFGALSQEAGGIAPRAVFYRTYEAASGRRLAATRIHFWEVAAALRWLVIALRQRDRFLKQGERSLDLALTGRRPAESELEILLLTLPARAELCRQLKVDSGAEASAMRDRPDGETLMALADAFRDEEVLALRGRAIATREARSGVEAFAATRAALRARYGLLDDRGLLVHLAADVRAGLADRSGDGRDWLASVLWDLTQSKLRDSNPDFLAANRLV